MEKHQDTTSRKYDTSSDPLAPLVKYSTTLIVAAYYDGSMMNSDDNRVIII